MPRIKIEKKNLKELNFNKFTTQFTRVSKEEWKKYTFFYKQKFSGFITTDKESWHIVINDEMQGNYLNINLRKKELIVIDYSFQDINVGYFSIPKSKSM